MSTRNNSTAAKAFRMPESFDFGLEKRTIVAKKLQYDSDMSQCCHKWFKRDETAQTVSEEGKTVWECHDCKKVATSYDWENPGTQVR